MSQLSVGDNQSANTLLSLTSDLPNLNLKRVNLNNARMLSLNAILTLSENIKLKTLGFLNTDKTDFFRNSFQEFSVGTSAFQNREDMVAQKSEITGFGKMDLTYDISKTKTLEYIGKFNRTHLDNKSDLTFNGDLLNENLQNRNELADHKLVYTSKLNEHKVILITARHINEKTPQNYSLNKYLYPELLLLEGDSTLQKSRNNMRFTGAEAHFLNKIANGDLLEIRLGNQLRRDILQTDFLLNSLDEVRLKPEGFQNNVIYSTNDSYISAKYRKKMSKLSLITQADFHKLINRLDNSDNTNTDQTPFFIVPKVGVDWKIDAKNKMLTSYTYSVSNAGILDVYTGYVQTGFRSFSKGSGEFNQLNASQAALNYVYGNWGDRFFANSYLIYSKNHDFFSTNAVILQNYSLSEKIIIKDREFLSLVSNVDRYFNALKSNLKLSLSGSNTNFKNIVNNSDFREVKNLNLEYGFELRSGFSGIFNCNIGSKWNFNQIKTNIADSFTDNMTFLDMYFMCSDKLNFQFQAERYFFGNLDKAHNQYYFLDLQARYAVKENKLMLSLAGNNLLNTETFRKYSITDINISRTEYRLQPRYVLLKVEYRF
jgi:hypothetical protein